MGDKKLKQLRGSMTQAELARISGVDKAIISKIESGKMSGTVGCHKKIAEALGLKLSEFYQHLETGKTQSTEFRPGSQKKNDDYPAFMDVLTALPMSKRILPVFLTLEPHQEAFLPETPKEVERFFILFEGEMDIENNGKFYYLKKDKKIERGDSLYTVSSHPYHLKNPGASIARALSVSSPAAL